MRNINRILDSDEKKVASSIIAATLEAVTYLSASRAIIAEPDDNLQKILHPYTPSGAKAIVRMLWDTPYSDNMSQIQSSGITDGTTVNLSCSVRGFTDSLRTDAPRALVFDLSDADTEAEKASIALRVTYVGKRPRIDASYIIHGSSDKKKYEQDCFRWTPVTQRNILHFLWVLSRVESIRIQSTGASNDLQTALIADPVFNLIQMLRTRCSEAYPLDISAVRPCSAALVALASRSERVRKSSDYCEESSTKRSLVSSVLSEMSLLDAAAKKTDLSVLATMMSLETNSQPSTVELWNSFAEHNLSIGIVNPDRRFFMQTTSTASTTDIGLYVGSARQFVTTGNTYHRTIELVRSSAMILRLTNDQRKELLAKANGLKVLAQDYYRFWYTLRALIPTGNLVKTV